MKYNLKVIMKRAWEIKKEDSRNIFSLCLKMAWEEAKTPFVYYGIQSWFLYKNFDQNERYIIQRAEFSDELNVAAITEKAVKFIAHSDFGTFRFWVPKKCLITEEEIIRKEQALEKGLEYNRTLLQIAKNNGLRVRKGMKTQTLVAKLRQAQIEIPEKK